MEGQSCKTVVQAVLILIIKMQLIKHKAMNSDNGIKRGAGILLEGVMPFRKTPMNIVKQGLNYSPASILKIVYKGVLKLKNGQAYGATDVIEDIAKGLTGTGLMFLGLLMSNMGLIVGGDDEDKKKRTFNKMVGEQSYAIKVGDGSYTIDWMTPVCLPLFVGVELDRLTEDEFSVSQVTEAMSTLTEPLLELSVLSGVSDAISSAQYNDTKVLYSVVSEMASSYALQGLPTVGGQLSRIIDNNKRDCYFTDKNSQMPKLIQRMAGQMASKIPFASYLFTESVDNWGRGTKYGSLGERVLENFISPRYYSKVDYTNVDKELQRLYGKTGDNKVLPVTQQKYFVSGGVYYYMTSKQFAETKRLRGQESFRLVEELIGSAEYRSMTDEEKVKAISRCYENAGKYAKEQMLDEVMGN